MVDEPEEEAPPSRPPRMSLSAAVRDTVAMLRNVPPGDDPYPPRSCETSRGPRRPRRLGPAEDISAAVLRRFGRRVRPVRGLRRADGPGLWFTRRERRRKTTTVSMVCRVERRPATPSRGKSLGRFRATQRSLGCQLVEINQCSGAPKFFTKSFLGMTWPSWLGRAVRTASPRHRAGVASMAWRTMRIQHERAV